jgi:hypothetical protein
MSISELYDSGFRKRNTDHFAAIVRVAMSDGVITDSEKEFIDRLASNLDVTETDYKAILKDHGSHPINPPVSYNSRLERLFDLTRMIWADGVKGEAQEKLLHKFCVGLGFHAVNVKYIADKALELVKNEVTLEEFQYGIKNMNQ